VSIARKKVPILVLSEAVASTKGKRTVDPQSPRLSKTLFIPAGLPSSKISCIKGNKLWWI
jgi:hypothetical protein